MDKILCFGVFDGVHDGHRAMLKEAKSLEFRADSNKSTLSLPKSAKLKAISSSSHLIVAVASDDVVKILKGAMPKHNSAQRIAMLKSEYIADSVVLGDEEVNSWKILKKTKPTIIALGYDQHELREKLEEYLEKSYPEIETEEGPPEDVDGRVNWRKIPKKPKIVILSPHKPETHHNRIMKQEVRSKE